MCTNNCLLGPEMIRAAVHNDWRRDAVVIPVTNIDGWVYLYIEVGGAGGIVEVPLMQRTWAMDDLMSTWLRPRLNALLDGNT